jgi:hypothetical protein
MAIPPDPILRAAVRWLEYLPGSDINRTRSLFNSTRSLRDITPTQYARAYDWLESRGLFDNQDLHGDQASIKVLRAAVIDALWFRDADDLIPDVDSLPEDLIGAATAVNVGLYKTFAVVRDLWTKVDDAQRKLIGAAGEEALVSILSNSDSLDVRHVAKESDAYGYDIEARSTDQFFHLEVKSTTRRNRIRFYLSRNEFETMRRDPSWILVVVRLDDQLKIANVATVDTDWIANTAPGDRDASTRWESSRFDVPPALPDPGISVLASHVDWSQISSPP